MWSPLKSIRSKFIPLRVDPQPHLRIFQSNWLEKERGWGGGKIDTSFDIIQINLNIFNKRYFGSGWFKTIKALKNGPLSKVMPKG